MMSAQGGVRKRCFDPALMLSSRRRGSRQLISSSQLADCLFSQGAQIGIRKEDVNVEYIRIALGSLK
jgi:hypothetical protein